MFAKVKAVSILFFLVLCTRVDPIVEPLESTFWTIINKSFLNHISVKVVKEFTILIIPK